MTLTLAWLLAWPLAAKGPDPADVKPGWLGFTVFLLLAAATALLLMSFRKQLTKIDFEEEPDEPGRDALARRSGPAPDHSGAGPDGRGSPGGATRS